MICANTLKIIFCSILFCLVSEVGFAEVVQTVTLDGRLFMAGSTNPLLDNSVKLSIQVLDPSGTCLLYEEEQTVNTRATNGYFNVQVGSHRVPIGSDTSYLKRTSNDLGHSMNMIYQNTTTFAAADAPGFACVSGATYTPNSGDARLLRVIVTPTSGPPDRLIPDLVMSSASSAVVAESLQGYRPNQILILGNGDLTQSNLQTVFATGNAAKLNSLLAHDPSLYVRKDVTNGTIQLPSAASPASPVNGQLWYDAGVIKFWNGSEQVLGVSGAGVTTLNAGTGLNVGVGPGGTISTGGQTLNIDVGVTAGKIVQVAAGNRLPALDASLVTNLNASEIQAGTIGGTTSINTTGTIQSGAITSTGTVTGVSLIADSLSVKGINLQNALSQTLSIVPASSISAPLSFTWPGSVGSANQVLSTDGASGTLSWRTMSSADLSNNADLLKVSNMPANCGSGQTLTFSSPSASWVCTNIQVDPTNFPNQNQRLFLAGPISGGPAVPTFRTMAKSDLPSSAIVDGLQAGALNIGSNDANSLTFSTNANPVMTLSPAGKIGLGTASPTALLDLHFADQDSSEKSVRIYDSTSGGSLKFGEGTGGVGVFMPSIELSPRGSEYGSLVESVIPTAEDNGNVPALIMRSRTDAPGSLGSRPILSVQNNLSEVLRIEASGRVGVGTSSPTALLHLKAGSATAGSAPLKLSAGTNLAAVENGAVEFDGTNLFFSAAGVRRTIASTSGGSIGGNISSITNSSGSITLNPMVGNSVIVNSTTPSTGSTSGSLIVSGGVGIGGSLNVAGSVGIAPNDPATGVANVNGPPLYLQANYWDGAVSRLDSWSITNILGTGTSPSSTLTFAHPSGSSGTKRYAFLDGGIGIGTSTGTNALDIVNTTSANRRITMNGVTVSYIPDQTNTQFIGSMFIGNGAASLETDPWPGAPAPVPSTGKYNTSVGIGSTSSITKAYANTSVGYQSLRDLTTGYGNTSTGMYAMRFSTTAQQTSAYGYRALYNNTSGYQNTAIGNDTLYFNTTGINNTALGMYSLHDNTTGNYNTAAGFQAAKTLTTGASNSAFGHNALMLNETGYDNAALGMLSLYGAAGASAFQNTGVGARAFQSVTTGDNNTGIGNRAGVGITTGRANTIIGANTAFSAGDAGLSNTVVIADGDGNQRIRVTNTGMTGFGTESPLAHLHGYKNDVTAYDPLAVDAQIGNGPTLLLENPGNINNGIGGQIVFGMRTPRSYARIGATGGSNPSLTFGTAAAERMRITSTGSLGLGTSNPGAKLHVVGATNQETLGTGALRVGGVSGATYLEFGVNYDYTNLVQNNAWIQANSGGVRPLLLNPIGGSVGIGVANPSAKLEVNGHIKGSTFEGSSISTVGTFIVNTDSDNAGLDGGISFQTNGSTLASVSTAGAFKSAYGSLSAPGYAFQSDSATGMYRSAASTLSFAAGGVEALRLQNTLGAINFTSISPAITGSAPLISAAGSDTNISLSISPKGSGHLLLSGNVGIGTMTPEQRLHLAASGSSTQLILERTGANAGKMGIGADNLGLSFLDSSYNRRMTIQAGGNVGVGTSSPSEKLHIAGNLRVQGTTDCTLGNGSGGTNCTSDERLKTNIREIEAPLTKILALRGVEFEWNQKSSVPGRSDIGVIAQDIEKQFPTAVISDSTSGYKKVDYAVLVAPLIGATKEIYMIVSGMLKDLRSNETQVRQLKGEIAEIKTAHESMQRELRQQQELSRLLQNRLREIEDSLKKQK